VGKPSDAEEAFERAVQLQPTWDEAHVRLGTVLFFVLGEKEKGAKHFRKALELNPSAHYADELRKVLSRYRNESRQQTG